jgi:hypothetical protein
MLIGANHLSLSIFGSYHDPNRNICSYELQYTFRVSSTTKVSSIGVILDLARCNFAMCIL